MALFLSVQWWETRKEQQYLSALHYNVISHLGRPDTAGGFVSCLLPPQHWPCAKGTTAGAGAAFPAASSCAARPFSWLGCLFALVRAQLQQRRSVGRGRTCRVAFYFVFYFFSLSLFYFFVVGMLSDLRRGAAVCACDCLSVHAVASCPCFLRLHAWGQRESARAQCLFVTGFLRLWAGNPNRIGTAAHTSTAVKQQQDSAR